MGVSDKFQCFIFLLLGLTLGLVTTKIYNNLPYFDWDKEVDVIALINLIVTIVIAFLIPLTIKKLVEDNRHLKGALIEEIKILIEILKGIKKIIQECHERGDITAKDKDRVNYIFHEADLQLNSIRSQLGISFPKKSESLTSDLTDKYFEYHSDLTGGLLMTSKFTVIDDQFRRKHDTDFSNLVTDLKKAIHQIHKY